MVLTRKSTGGAGTRSRLTRTVSGMLGRTIDRRAFLKSSGITIGAGAVASQLPFSVVQEARSAEQTANNVEVKRTICTHCSVGCAMFADWCAGALRTPGLSRCSAVAVDCAGDVRVTGMAREVHVADPVDGGVLHTFTLRDAAIATSGVTRRGHHLVDPASGRPARTGVLQASAIAPTALEAEVRAKAALLSGPQAAADWLPYGGVVVLESAEVLVLAAVGGDGGDDGVAFHEVQRVEPLAQLAGLRVA